MPLNIQQDVGGTYQLSSRPIKCLPISIFVQTLDIDIKCKSPGNPLGCHLRPPH